ncbi:hypothetical protein DIPPA_12464 [Diplonema papillatum]|nr:hypothetical protein DIPPA_12464 [Diplonema papillatum]
MLRNDRDPCIGDVSDDQSHPRKPWRHAMFGGGTHDFQLDPQQSWCSAAHGHALGTDGAPDESRFFRCDAQKPWHRATNGSAPDKEGAVHRNPGTPAQSLLVKYHLARCRSAGSSGDLASDPLPSAKAVDVLRGEVHRLLADLRCRMLPGSAAGNALRNVPYAPAFQTTQGSPAEPDRSSGALSICEAQRRSDRDGAAQGHEGWGGIRAGAVEAAWRAKEAAGVSLLDELAANLAECFPLVPFFAGSGAGVPSIVFEVVQAIGLLGNPRRQPSSTKPCGNPSHPPSTEAGGSLPQPGSSVRILKVPSSTGNLKEPSAIETGRYPRHPPRSTEPGELLRTFVTFLFATNPVVARETDRALRGGDFFFLVKWVRSLLLLHGCAVMSSNPATTEMHSKPTCQQTNHRYEKSSRPRKCPEGGRPRRRRESVRPAPGNQPAPQQQPPKRRKGSPADERAGPEPSAAALRGPGVPGDQPARPAAPGGTFLAGARSSARSEGESRRPSADAWSGGATGLVEGIHEAPGTRARSGANRLVYAIPAAEPHGSTLRWLSLPVDSPVSFCPPAFALPASPAVSACLSSLSFGVPPAACVSLAPLFEDRTRAWLLSPLAALTVAGAKAKSLGVRVSLDDHLGDDCLLRSLCTNAAKDAVAVSRYLVDTCSNARIRTVSGMYGRVLDHILTEAYKGGRAISRAERSARICLQDRIQTVHRAACSGWQGGGLQLGSPDLGPEELRGLVGELTAYSPCGRGEFRGRPSSFSSRDGSPPAPPSVALPRAVRIARVCAVLRRPAQRQFTLTLLGMRHQTFSSLCHAQVALGCSRVTFDLKAHSLVGAPSATVCECTSEPSKPVSSH